MQASTLDSFKAGDGVREYAIDRNEMNLEFAEVPPATPASSNVPVKFDEVSRFSNNP